MAKLVSQVYAEALFDLGVESDLLDSLKEELDGMCRILQDYPDFYAILLHPQIDHQEKLQVFERVFGGKISQEMAGFCRLLLEKEDSGSFPVSGKTLKDAVWTIKRQALCM